MRSTSWALLAAAALAACASGGSTTQAGPSAARPAPSNASAPAPARSSRTVMLRTELTEVQQAEMDALTAIRQYRPNMLTGTNASTMGGASGSGITVFLNGNKQGGLEALRSIRMIEVEKIEYINGSEATQRFGTGYAGGAILVTRRK